MGFRWLQRLIALQYSRMWYSHYSWTDRHAFPTSLLQSQFFFICPSAWSLVFFMNFHRSRIKIKYIRTKLFDTSVHNLFLRLRKSLQIFMFWNANTRKNVFVAQDCFVYDSCLMERHDPRSLSFSHSYSGIIVIKYSRSSLPLLLQSLPTISSRTIKHQNNFRILSPVLLKSPLSQ